jgi:hypothetical protein
MNDFPNSTSEHEDALSLTGRALKLENKFNELVEKNDSNWPYVAELSAGKSLLKDIKKLESDIYEQWRKIIQDEVDTHKPSSAKKAKSKKSSSSKKADIEDCIKSASTIQALHQRMAGLELGQTQTSNPTKQAARLINSGLYEEALKLLSTTNTRKISTHSLYEALNSIKHQKVPTPLWPILILVLLLSILALNIYQLFPTIQTVLANAPTETSTPTIVATAPATPLPTLPPTSIPTPTQDPNTLTLSINLTATPQATTTEVDVPREVFALLFEIIASTGQDAVTLTISSPNHITRTIQLNSVPINLEPVKVEHKEGDQLKILDFLDDSGTSIAYLDTGTPVWLLQHSPNQQFYFIYVLDDGKKPILGWIPKEAIDRTNETEKSSESQDEQ